MEVLDEITLVVSMLTVSPSLLHRPNDSRWTGTVPLLVSVSWSKWAEVACC